MEPAKPTDDAVKDPELELLVLRCQMGEAEAFDQLVAEWHPRLWRVLVGTVRDAGVAEEVMQETWLRILGSLERLRDPQRLRPWLFSVLRVTLADRLRLVARGTRSEPLAEEPVDSGGERARRQQVEFESLGHALAGLAEPDRQALVLFHLRQLSLREVSERLGIPRGTVKSRLHRARAQLRAALSDSGDEA